MVLTKLASNLCFAGLQQQFSHFSTSVNGDMRFSIFLPPQAQNKKVPVLYWLSGLTCTDENFTQKAGAQRIAAQLGIAIVAPDTSPRGADVADDPNASYDVGLGAGFYLNATQKPWSLHYQMYDYVVNELPSLIETHFPVSNKRSISGHSMGGHGALTIGLKNPEQYVSISAFSPICHPSASPWGIKAFSHYLGEDKAQWQQYDATLLISKVKQIRPIRIDQGLADQFLEKELQPEQLITAATKAGYPIEYYTHSGYDHSYYFIASFIEEHLRFHAKHHNS